MSSTWISSSAELLAVVHEMMRVGLPSGQQVARAMRVNVLSNATLGLSNVRDGVARHRCGSTS
jgi:hypothetical protein